MNNNTSSNNFLIAKNTVFLYFRTFVVLVVSLYTSRVILDVLGVDDLGIYNVVGGIVAMMAFFHATLNKATTRFITYELGIKEKKEWSIFSTCLTIHIIISLVVFFLGESIGLWLINNATKIPLDRLFAANCVYQCSLLIFFVHIIKIPYESVFIAHENMSVYAYISMFEAFGMCGIVLGLNFIGGDSLILYGIFSLVIALLLFFVDWVIVKLKYPQYSFSLRLNRSRMKEILFFSGWTVFGSSTNAISQQGVVLLMNNFVGLVANAALGFAQQVNAALCKFTGSFAMAFNPQLIKLSAQQDYTSLHTLMNRSSKLSFILAYIIALPILINLNDILHLWLGVIPKYAYDFCFLMLICSVFDALTGPLNTVIMATGQIKNYQICISCSFFLDFLVALLLLLFNFHPAAVFGSRLFTRCFLNMCFSLYFCRKKVHFPTSSYLKVVILPSFIVIVCSCFFAIFTKCFWDDWDGKLISTVGVLAIICLLTLFVVFDRNERKKCLEYIRRNR